MMNYIVLDTETVNLDTPFCYDFGYIIVLEDGSILKRNYLNTRVFDNVELFATSYFADKRKMYLNKRYNKEIKAENWGYISDQFVGDIHSYNITKIFAYNCDFDKKVYEFNCEWFGGTLLGNDIEWVDIRGFVHKVLAFNPYYQEFCDKNKYYTQSGNYSTTAEVVGRYLFDDNLIESHTALDDAILENDILTDCIGLGCDLNKNYKTYRSIPRKKQVSVFVDGKEIITTSAKSVKYNIESGKVVIK